MPVYECAGPDCKRLISVSNVPGGNPAALADPEGFATVYLQCRSCKKYFCDRSLTKLGKSMSETRCPSCQGPLFNPNTSIANPGATPQPATLPVFQKTRVVVAGKSLLFPNACACCGGPSDTTYTLTGYNTTYSGRTRTTTTTRWPMSSCTKCAPHFNSYSFENTTKTIPNAEEIKPGVKEILRGVGGAILFGALAAFAVNEPQMLEYALDRELHVPFMGGAAALGFFVYWFFAKRKVERKRMEAIDQNLRAKNEVERNAAGKASLGTNCCRSEKGAICVEYVLMNNNSHSFTFYRKDFADTFARLNQANTVSVERFK